jgi:hypothetical protein
MTAYEKALKELNLKVGDKVKVVKRVEELEGWNNDWLDSMDSYIGKVFEVLTKSYDPHLCGVPLKNISIRFFPPTALEKVEESSENQEVTSVVDEDAWEEEIYTPLTLQWQEIITTDSNRAYRANVPEGYIIKEISSHGVAMVFIPQSK